MAINNEELMDKLVRTGMILRHIDNGGPFCKKHGHHGHKGPHAHHGGSARPCGPEGHPEFPAEGAPESHVCHGHGHGHGPRRGGHRQGQARVLTAVAMKEGINQKELAFLLGIRPQTLGAMLQKLEEFEMVERKKSETDGRAIEVWLTDAGRTHAAEIAERHALAATDILAILSEEEKEQLGGILDKIGAELEKHRPRPHGRCCKQSEDDMDKSES
ncbi:MAG: winged helix-turn-helix transcriptional regulator [Eggerthellaceae bacterium]|nr:winged helix-turn-helix transcriptional regulator [Eggerthellaceae bacterium]